MGLEEGAGEEGVGEEEHVCFLLFSFLIWLDEKLVPIGVRFRDNSFIYTIYGCNKFGCYC